MQQRQRRALALDDEAVLVDRGQQLVVERGLVDAEVGHLAIGTMQMKDRVFESSDLELAIGSWRREQGVGVGSCVRYRRGHRRGRRGR